jgi:hypothetical protein
MPRDSHLLSEMSRQLLRIARAPRVSKRSEPAEDEEKENAEDMESKDNSRGFTVKKWVQMPKGYEASDRDYLAKRRKGLPPLHAGYGVSVPLDQSKTYRTLKVRRADINGVEHVYEVMAEVGQVVEGEILEADKAVAAPVDPPAAPGTIIEGVGVVNSDGVVIAQPTPKRKPLPPRRKKKGGPGRSKKKLLPELGPDGVPIVSSDAANAALTSDAIGSTAVDTENGDTPMPDAPEGEEDEEGSGEEGDEMDEDDGHEDGEISATSTPAQAQLLDPEPPKTEPSEDETLAETILSAPQLVSAHVAISTEAALETASDTVPDTSSFSEVLLPTVEPEMPMSELPILEVPTVELQSPAADPVIVPPPADVQVQSAEPIIPSIITEAPVLPAAPAPLPIMEPDPHPAPAEPFIAPVMTTPPALIPEPLTPEPEEVPAPSPPPAPIVAAAEPVAAVEPVADAPLTAVPTEAQIPPPPATNEDDEVVFEDGEVDLLGSLEAQLDKQGAESKGLDKLDDSEETPKVD